MTPGSQSALPASSCIRQRTDLVKGSSWPEVVKYICPVGGPFDLEMTGCGRFSPFSSPPAGFFCVWGTAILGRLSPCVPHRHPGIERLGPHGQATPVRISSGPECFFLRDISIPHPVRCWTPAIGGRPWLFHVRRKNTVHTRPAQAGNFPSTAASRSDRPSGRLRPAGWC